MSRRQDIDGLRALAVLAVIAFHGNIPTLKGGLLGVDVFFVLSGFVITALIAEEVRKGHFTLTGFWARRARRIVPPLLPVLAFVLTAGWFLLPPAHYAALGEQLMAQPVFIANHIYVLQAQKAPETGLFRFLLHTWSLSIEGQFYLLYPLFLVPALRRGARQAVMVLLAALGAAYATAMWAEGWMDGMSFYLLPARAWEFLLGALAALAPQTRLGKGEREALAAAGLLAVAGSFLTFDPALHNAAPWRASLLPCVGTTLLLWAGAGKTGEKPLTNKCLSLRPLAALGLVSYAVYLWHWPLIASLRLVMPNAPAAQVLGIALATTALLSVLSWFLIEKPAQRAFTDSRKFFLALFIALFVLSAAGGVARMTQGVPSRTFTKLYPSS